MIPSPIFQNITDKDWNEMRQHALLRESSYEKNAVIFHTGQMTEEIGVVVNGCIHIENIDLLGNKSILSDISAGQVFAETYAFCEEPLMVDVVAAADSTILFLNVKKMLLPQYNSYHWQTTMRNNLLISAMHKNLILSQRIFCTTSKTIRGRILTYLSAQALKQNNARSFEIPFDRQQLADYLNVDRSALSKELGKMQEEGIITFRKNFFTIHDFF
ncbi:MAG: Crp/Fnr family transcriptional regulator [Lachnospiraceae bacterium]|nr:Crp/Fnr family transcriptional regulator [Lachnospiraceae bacterium]HCJ07560.1 Crp/Fnr family transcriptional regulator [Lachnospiraceae bacterium]